MAVAEVPARAALAGNPSDLYGGAVLAVPVRSLRARVEIEPAADIEIIGPGAALIEATLHRMAAPPVRVVCDTTIPRSVGLAGSSAIVIATLRALQASVEDPLELALLAQSIETDDLGIVAGLQDRAVQAFERPVLVDMSGATPVVTPLSPARPIRIAVAWDASASADSGTYHRALRESAPDVSELAVTARRAADAFVAGDAEALAALVNESGRLRAHLAPLPAEHDRIASIITGNSAGSGGSVAAVALDDTTIAADHVVETYT